MINIILHEELTHKKEFKKIGRVKINFRQKEIISAVE